MNLVGIFLRMAGQQHARTACIAGCIAISAALVVGDAAAGKHVAFAALSGVEEAQAAARVWANDASLVYVENDEDVSDAGSSSRWGYLYYSPALQAARSYSVRDGRIVVAENLDMKFEAPALTPGWMDSGAALAVAEQHGGSDYRRRSGARVGTMLLSRGAFQPGAPDLTTWTIIYTASGAPSLFIVVDAAKGRVCRTWRG